MTESIVAICMPGAGHLQRLLPLVEALCARGRTVHVLTHADYQRRVEQAGGRFVDLFARYPIEAADATSIPIPSRYVSFAAVYAERLTADVAVLAPALIVYDTFAVVAPLIARRLGIPYVNVCCGHAAEPSRTVASLRRDPRVATSAECWAAVQRLKDVHGMSDANPFSYVAAQSPFLNLYGEPAEFLDEADRPAFEPIAFFGSLAPPRREETAISAFRGRRGALRIYVSFGTVIWRYFAPAALAALNALASAFADLDVDAVISLGGHPIGPAERVPLTHPKVRVVDYADQCAVLRETDIFITHHGLNSTHESIFHQVPMISYPFFGDQPALARRCQDLGLAVPLVGKPRAPIDRDALQSAITRVTDDRDGLATRLDEARSWELRTIAARGAIIDRVLALAERG
jgi:MGT family glycosyltransferase